MRLHRLELQAFGSFAGHEVLDVDRLCESGLFLLHGPTGAGKTTLLDAVSFALYGAVPGVRAADEGLRSHHAPPTLPTEVTLELTVRDRRFRIRRSPRQHRPKRRGVGVTVEQPRVTVEERVAGEWVARTNRLDEAGDLVADLIGMGATQFHQVAVLPQGGFAEFLRADAKDRGALLEQLFATHRFTLVEQWLADRRKELADQVAVGRSQVEGAVTSLRAFIARLPADPADPADDEPDSDGPTVADAPAWAAAQLAVAEAVVARTDAVHADAEARARAAREALAAATEVAHRQDRHAAASRRLRDLLADEPDQVARLTERDAARRAAALDALLDDLGRRERAADDADRQADEARAALARLDGVPADLDDASLEEALEAAVARHAEAGELRALADDVRRRRQDLTARRTLHGARLAEQQAATDALESLPDRLEEAGRRVEEASAAHERLPGLEHRVTDTLARRDAGRRRDALRDELAAADEQRRAAVDAHQRTTDEHQRLVARRLDGMAAELASGLAPGHDCPVCGATEHPAPARPGDGGLVTAVDVDAAHTASRAAGVLREEAEARHAALAAELAKAEGLAGEVPLGRLEHEATEADAALAEARRLADALDLHRDELSRLEQEEEALRRQHDEAARAVASLTGSIESEAAELATAEDRLADGLGDHPDPEALVAATGRTVELLRAARAAVGRSAGCRTEADEAAVRAREAAATAGFASLDEVRSAQRDPVALTALEAAVEAHTVALARARGETEDPDLLAASRADRPDLTALTTAFEDADAALERAAGERELARGLRDGIAEQVARVVALADTLGPLLVQHDTVEGLAQLAAGTGSDNALRMQLSSYVLAARLEQVAAAASERLVRMSGGRYVLRHCDTEGDGRKRAGLGLEVVDAWSTTTRDTRSLSGGETFFASLALALGMADVVTAESGGTRIDTLFIDEGFGSLDDETLGDVMDVLDDLREGGRTVGIVSHVADLRDRIAAQVEVCKAPTGSSLRTAVAVG